MDPERLPTPALPQSEVTSPAHHTLGEDTSRTSAMQANPVNPVNPFHPPAPRTIVRLDTEASTLGPFVPNSPSPTSSDALVKLEDNEASSTVHHPRNENNNPTQPMTSSIRFPESAFGRRGTRTSNNNRFSDNMTRHHSGDDSSFDWKENVNNVFFCHPNLNLFT